METTTYIDDWKEDVRKSFIYTGIFCLIMTQVIVDIIFVTKLM